MVKIISTLVVEVSPSKETVEQPFFTKTQELLKARKLIAACDASFKNSVMEAWWFITARYKEELMCHEMHVKHWNFNTSKTVEVAILLETIATLRVKSINENQGKEDS